MGLRLFVVLGGALLATACTNDFDALTSDDGAGAAIAGGGPSASSATASAAGTGNMAAQGSSSGIGSGGAGATGAEGGAGNPGGAGGAGQGGDGGTPVIVGCDRQYGSVAGYVPCPAAAGECGFNLNAGSQTSCNEQCQLRGGECLDAIDNLAPCEVYGTGEAGCGDTHWGSVWCVCSHGCGGGPPCASGTTCSNGACS